MTKKTIKKKTRVGPRRSTLKIYPMYPGRVLGLDGRLYDTTLVEWKDFQRELRSLHGPDKVAFLEKMLSYLIVHRVSSRKPFAFSYEEQLMSHPDKMESLKKRGVKLLAPLIVQQQSGFTDFVFSNLKKLALDGFFPLFYTRLSPTREHPIRFDLRAIEKFGEETLSEDLNEQILFYSNLLSVVRGIPESKESYDEKQDVYLIFKKDSEKRHLRKYLAPASIVLQFAEAKYQHHKERQAQLSLKQKVHRVHPKPAFKSFLHSVSITTKPNASKDLLRILTSHPSLNGAIVNNIYRVHPAAAMRNVHYVLLKLRKENIIPNETHANDLGKSVYTFKDNKWRPTTAGSWDTANSRIFGKRKGSSPDEIIRSAVEDYIKKYK